MKCITISVQGFFVGALWTIGFGLAIFDIFTGFDLGTIAIAVMVVGATMLVKGAVDRYAANWTQAYEVGRDAGEGKVRRIR